jgi:sortase (surface protein transpeptidase)
MEMTRMNGTGSRPITRRDVLAGAAVLSLAAPFGIAATAAAQEQIVSTQRGEIPTTGGQRPGPIGIEPEVSQAQGVLPISIAIEAINLNAQVETIQIVDGVMQDPTGPWVVSWYKETGKLGEIDNVVMAGHLDYWDVGPAVFYSIGQLQPNDQIDVTGDDGETYSFAVEWVEQYDAANAPIQDIIGPTDAENLTLITCGGPFDYQNGVYLQRTVVRAHRIAN